MISFIIAVIVLIAGYYLISNICEKIFGVDSTKQTPANTMNDGIDFVPLPLWKIFLIQFLNIAGLGPIFGAVAGAMWGPVAFVWIVLGTLLAGGVHDYFSGMLSLKHKGQSITEISGFYLGDWVKHFMRVFSIVLLIMVGTVFIMGPAKLLMDLTDGFGGMFFWIALIFIYYILSTVLPIDQIIGKIYPVFGVALLFMALGIVVMMVYHKFPVPEITLAGITNQHHNPGTFPIFPFVFVTIACGAISGFHATQSPLMARCMTNEKQGRPVFFGTMVTEGIVALIWAAISMSFFGGVTELNKEMAASGGNAATVVSTVSKSLMGPLGGALVLIGVIAAPITSGDTAFRSARIIIADMFKFNQKPLTSRLVLAFPLFLISVILLTLDFSVIWRYFAWTNQTLATIVLWTVTAYLIRENKFFWISFFPAVFMTAVVVTYILVAPEGFAIEKNTAYWIGIGAAILAAIYTLIFINKQRAAAIPVQPLAIK